MLAPFCAFRLATLETTALPHCLRASMSQIRTWLSSPEVTILASSTMLKPQTSP